MATRSARDNKALNARHAEVLKAMLRKPENKLCADCKKNDPRWASTNLGCFMCIRCSGIHRSMGVHITRIKSIDLDTWTPEQVACVQRWGNKRANAYWEAHLRPGHMPPDHKIESFIRSKYESKRWAMEGPIPEPETLDSDEDNSAADPAPVARKASVSASATSQITSPGLNKPSAPTSVATNSFNLFDESPLVTTQVHPTSQSPQSAKVTSGTANATQTNHNTSGAGGGLLDLDFSPQASSAAKSATAPAARKDVKNDILSLFAVKPQIPGNNFAGQNPNFSAMNNQFNGLNLGGAASTVPLANNINHSFGDASNVWGSAVGQQQQRQQAQDPFGSFTSATNSTSRNNKDVFSDIWS